MGLFTAYPIGTLFVVAVLVFWVMTMLRGRGPDEPGQGMCRKCGTTPHVGAKFCQRCGEKI